MRTPIPSVAEPFRPDAPFAPRMTPGPFPPRHGLIVDAGTGLDSADALRRSAGIDETASWAGGWGEQALGSYAAAGHLFAATDADRAAEELDDALARRIKRILDGEARRYGIDV